ncbi:uncharacterized protein Tco025E_08618 [Trypanosoma conorhini]|uniref:Uncharacterized protein n=1 Tax=Trypanosoma conorhini TaxID=83891 RepID=A0A422N6U0_9TRYP|nr:uncharacterized protein Tco025E_08618 [Trypanosoma conorhini]RNF01198.1 hypothetical protein Tco025E_08618 [Trypanosoma conorhini]
MHAASSLSRRVRVGGVEPEDAVLRAELFRTLAGYGLIEEACFEEDRAFHSGAAIVQFQRLSAAEKLQGDAEALGRRWGVTFLPPVVHVGTELLVTSPRAIDTAHLRSLVAEGVAGVTLEEKLLSFPGATRGESTAAVEGAGAEFGGKDAGAGETFAKALACVRAHAVGRFAVVMRFATVHDANHFLSTHQLPLATTHELYVVHVGPNAELQHALKHILLTRRSVKEVARGSLLRGFVLPQRQGSSGGGARMTSCEVDAGLTRKGRPVLLRTQTNFVKTSPWDIVEVRLVSVDGGSSENLLEAELRGVVNAESGTAEAQRPTALLQRLRQMGGPTSASSSSLASASADSKKALAGKLYQALHARKPESGSAGEQLHGFPQGLHAFSVVSVRIQRVGDDGLYAWTIPPPHAASTASSREWPVFVPSLFVPREGGMGWQEFAVPGERMTVTLLYATAVGGSEAALRLVATKREADMRRASASAARALAPDAAEGAGGVTTAKTLTVGTSFDATRAIWLPRTPSTENPVYILLPSSSSPPALFSLTVLVHATETVADQPPEVMTIDAGLHPFVISEIVDSDRRGHYAVAVEAAAYRQMEAERRAVELQKESEQDALLQRILTEVLSSGTSLPAGDGEESAQSRKRLRSPQRG